MNTYDSSKSGPGNSGQHKSGQHKSGQHKSGQHKSGPGNRIRGPVPIDITRPKLCGNPPAQREPVTLGTTRLKLPMKPPAPHEAVPAYPPTKADADKIFDKFFDALKIASRMKILSDRCLHHYKCFLFACYADGTYASNFLFAVKLYTKLLEIMNKSSELDNDVLLCEAQRRVSEKIETLYPTWKFNDDSSFDVENRVFYKLRDTLPHTLDFFKNVPPLIMLKTMLAFERAEYAKKSKTK